MSLEANKAIVRKIIEEYNKQNFDQFDDLVAPDYIGRFSGPPISYKVWNRAPG
jgi:hypothetical protein